MLVGPTIWVVFWGKGNVPRMTISMVFQLETLGKSGASPSLCVPICLMG